MQALYPRLHVRLIRGGSYSMLSIARMCAVLSILGIVVLAGCARSPEAEKARHLGRADRYFGREQFREAVIEYANVLRIDGSHAHAVRQLALAHYHLGELGRAFPYLLKSRESDPGNLDVRLKLGTIYLMARRPADARREVALVLRKEPKNAEALLVWAQTAGTPQEIEAAIERLEEARTESGSRRNSTWRWRPCISGRTTRPKRSVPF